MNEKIMESENRNFTLYKRTGIGRGDTEFTTLKVVSSDDAYKYVIEIKFDLDSPNFNGQKVKYKIHDCYISYGSRQSCDTDQDIKTLIQVLNEALKFETKIRHYLSTVGDNY